jgi:DNA primase
VREVIFCFDGDRAGRAAAWRALQNALPEAQAGRELKFLFLPDGEDPDSLVGKEGKAAFEARFATALPLSEYLVAHLAESADISHADGKARFVAEAKPLLARIPQGAYRELMLDRLAQAIGVTAERFLTIVGLGASSPAPPVQRKPPPRSARGAGRGGLIRQAVKNLLDFPGVAARVAPDDRAQLDDVTEPGADMLRDLLDGLTKDPALNTAQVLERWREHPLAARLAQLAAEPSVLGDESAAGDELLTSLRELARGAATARLDALIAAERERTLTPAEQAILLRLLQTTRRG